MYIHVHGDKFMATKTISIDIEAYERLRSVRKDNESFSQTIKRVVKPPFDFEAFRKKVENFSLSDKAVEAIEQHIEDRHKPSNREY
jgi:predicted CopG family antitoxin